MVLQRIGSVGRSHDDDALDVYELRIEPDGAPVRHREPGLLEAVTRTPSYQAALRRMVALRAALVTDRAGFMTLHVSARHQGSAVGVELIEL